jgi:hypothetical protein
MTRDDEIRRKTAYQTTTQPLAGFAAIVNGVL